MRIGGLASGMDIDSLVKDLMKAERIPLDKLEQKRQWLEWQRDDYREMNKMLFDFDKQIFDGVYRQATYTQKKVDVSGEGVAVRNVSSTSDLTGTINVSQLAASAVMYSKPIQNDGSKIDSKAKLTTLGVAVDETITIKAINKDGTMDTQGYTYKIKSDDTLESVIEQVNKNSNVNMFFDSFTGQVSITAKNSGSNESGSEIELTGDMFSNVLRFDKNTTTGEMSNDYSVLQGHGSVGKNAIFSYNGLETQRNSNVVRLNGFEVTLKEAANKDISFSSSPDTDKIFETVLKFVDKYNEIIGKINSELNEKQYRDFKPLTAEQKESMEEKEIELWEEKARSGTLRRESIFSSGLNKMRMDLYTPVIGINPDYDQISEIGIKTSSNFNDRGKLIIDETKLKEAIAQNPNAIYELFTKDGTTTNEQGIARRLRDTIKDTMEGIEKKAGKATTLDNSFAIGRNLENVNNSMQRFQDRLFQIEDRYWRQFTAMEKAIQRSNQQSMFIMNSFGGGM